MWSNLLKPWILMALERHETHNELQNTDGKRHLSLNLSINKRRRAVHHNSKKFQSPFGWWRICTASQMEPFEAALSYIHVHTFLKNTCTKYLWVRSMFIFRFEESSQAISQKVKCCVRTACIIIFLYRFESPCQKYSYVISIFNGNIRELISVGSCFSSNKLYNLHWSGRIAHSAKGPCAAYYSINESKLRNA